MNRAISGSKSLYMGKRRIFPKVNEFIENQEQTKKRPQNAAGEDVSLTEIIF
ncbi:MAG: hypothetical protein V2J07_12010 [Anaerolineae bacterium]|jgi:hypothetical protein|nr:hypothetical protein [Anaerolineae bacterium]